MRDLSVGSARNDAQLRQDALHLLVSHQREIAAREDEVAVSAQEPRIARNRNGGLAAVARHHDDLHARRLYLRNRLARLGAHIIADCSKPDEHDIRIDLILAEGLRRVSKRQDAHGSRGIGVYFFVQLRRIEAGDCPVRRERVFRPREQRLGCALVDDRTARGQLRLTEFVRRVKRLPLSDAVAVICLHRTVGLCPEETHDRLIGRIAADDRTLLVVHGGGVHADGEFQLFIQSRMFLDLCEDTPACGKELHDLKLSARDRARLVAEEDVQRARRLDTDRTAHKDAAREHAARILHEHERDHERQPLGHGADDDEDGE